MSSARYRRLHRYAFDHPLVNADTALTSHSYLHLSGGMNVALSLNK